MDEREEVVVAALRLLGGHGSAVEVARAIARLGVPDTDWCRVGPVRQITAAQSGKTNGAAVVPANSREKIRAVLLRLERKMVVRRSLVINGRFALGAETASRFLVE